MKQEKATFYAVKLSQKAYYLYVDIHSFVEDIQILLVIVKLAVFEISIFLL